MFLGSDDNHVPNTEHQPMTVAIKNISSNTTIPISGVDFSVLVHNRKLFDEIEFDKKLPDYLGRRGYNPDLALLFAGNAYSGHNYHCAEYVNVFVQIMGRKHWHFISPEYALFLKPRSEKENPRQFFGSKHFESNEWGFSVEWGRQFNHVPHYEVVLQPGDLMVNPNWWLVLIFVFLN